MQNGIEEVIRENKRLKKLLDSHGIEHGEPLDTVQGRADGRDGHAPDVCSTCVKRPHTWESDGHGLTKEQIERYSRQLLLPSFGVKGVHTIASCQRFAFVVFHFSGP
jgi:predicted metal-binding protein